MGKKDAKNAAASDGQQITMPDGKKEKLTSGVYGTFVKHPSYLRPMDGSIWKSNHQLVDQTAFGTSTSVRLPRKMNLSKAHVMCAVQNNHYFLKDTSKQGTYVRIGVGGKTERYELQKNSIFAVGGVWLKVVGIEGNAACNAEEIEAAEKKAREEEKEGKAKKKEEKKDKGEDLDSDEEYADDSDDAGDSKAGGKAADASKPAKLVLAGLDKKLKLKASFYDTGYIGSDKEKCDRLPISETRAKSRKVDPLHSKIVFEDGRFYLEDAGSKFGTYIGIGKKCFFQVCHGDCILMARCRFTVVTMPMAMQPLQGFIDMLMGDMGTFDYNVKLLKTNSSVIERLNARKGLPYG